MNFPWPKIPYYKSVIPFMENYGNVVFPFTEFSISHPIYGITTFATTIKTSSQSFSTAGWWF
jgi:hypothetical protein